jgi:DNA-binding NarL/FixJ family response regulator
VVDEGGVRRPLDGPLLTVLAIEDDARTVRNWQRVLAGQAVLSPCRTLDEAWDRTTSESWRERHWQHVFLDLRLPDGDGEELLDRLSALHPKPAVAVVSGYVDSRRAVAINGRCALYVPKPADPDVLLGMLRILEVHRSGGSAIRDFAAAHHLSEQESRLLLAAIRDATNAEAADELGCSESTVRTYWSRILQKTQCGSARQVIACAFRFATQSR